MVWHGYYEYDPQNVAHSPKPRHYSTVASSNSNPAFYLSFLESQTWGAAFCGNLAFY